MANTKEIKGRIKSVEDTRKITNAMYMIASTKMRKAKAELDETRPYFEHLRREIQRIFCKAGDVKSRYFYSDKGEPPHKKGGSALLVVTADKGLAGAYNMNVIRIAEQILREKEDCRLFVVGEYGRQYFKTHGIPIEKSFLYTAQNPTMRRARIISHTFLEGYDSKELSDIHIVYTDFHNGLSSEALCERLLPFDRRDFQIDEGESLKTNFEFKPNAGVVLDSIMESYISGYIYSALVDSFCSEQNARMNAMSAANDNASDLLGVLNTEYNQIRQAAITQEITEISAGAKAQRAKRKRDAANCKEGQTLGRNH